MIGTQVKFSRALVAPIAFGCGSFCGVCSPPFGWDWPRPPRSAGARCSRSDVSFGREAFSHKNHIGIGAPGFPGDPCHTTGRAGPHPAVR